MDSPIQEFYGKVIANVEKLFDALRSPLRWLRYFLSFLRG
jgi:hypothetical protein